jgi:hypothetical protein
MRNSPSATPAAEEVNYVACWHFSAVPGFGSSVAIGGSPDMTRAVHFDSVDTAKNEHHSLPMDWQDLETFSFRDGPDLANLLLERAVFIRKHSLSF